MKLEGIANLSSPSLPPGGGIITQNITADSSAIDFRPDLS